MTRGKRNEARFDGFFGRQGRLHHRGRTGQGRSHAVRLAAKAPPSSVSTSAPTSPSNGYPMALADELDETIALVEAEGGKMLGSIADVRDFDQVKAALDAGVEQFGRLDIVLRQCRHRADGVSRADRSKKISTMWTDVLDVNLVGAYHTAKAAIPHLLAGNRAGHHFHQFDRRVAGFRRAAGRRARLRGVQARHRRPDAHAGQCACTA